MTESNKNTFVWRYLAFVLMTHTHTYVSVLYDIQKGWQNVGGRRTPKDAERFCRLLNAVRPDHRQAIVRQVPVRFVLGE